MSNSLKLVISIVLCQFVGIGTIISSAFISNWYKNSNEAPFNFHVWIFVAVWLILYLLMGLSIYMIWKEGLKNKEVKSAFILFFVQLIVNACWPIVLFDVPSITESIIAIVVSWTLILLTIIKFVKISWTAGFLLIPYLLWVTCVTILVNFAIILD